MWLPPPVPVNGEVRLRIDKTYKDAASYRVESGELVFALTLGIARNEIVLPAGHELLACNVPAQVLVYVNARPDEVGVLVRARRRIQ